MQPVRFMLSLALFGAAVLTVGRFADQLAAGEPPRQAPPAATFPASVAMLLADQAGRLDAGGVPVEARIERTRLSPRQMADATAADFGARLAAWRAARGAASPSFDSLSPDALTVPIRIDQPSWSLVGVVRQPEGFDEAGFATRADLGRLEPTDIATVLFATRGGPGESTTIVVSRLSAGDLAAPRRPLPDGLGPLDGQTTLYQTAADQSGSAAALTMRATDAPVEIAVRQRLEALGAGGAEARLLSSDQRQATLVADAPGWSATIILAALEPASATETISFKPSRALVAESRSAQP